MRREADRAQPMIGHISAYPVGSCFASRAELVRAGVHGARIAGIAGSGRVGARSVVLNGGYEDTEDYGAVILYTGHGGRDLATGRQVTHQTLAGGNLALALNAETGLPVRVIRGGRHPSPYAPLEGYRYDGLYRVETYWCETGKAGFMIWRYRLRQQPE